MPSQPELLTARLRLRPFRDSDVVGMFDLFSNETTARYIGGSCNDEDAWRRMATLVGHVTLRGYGVWAVEELASGAFVGYCGPWYPLGWPEPEIAWSLRSQFHGQGYATEAAREARSHAYDVLGWRTAISCIALENAASIRVALRLGAWLERTAVNRGWNIGIYRHPAPADRTSPRT